MIKNKRNPLKIILKPIKTDQQVYKGNKGIDTTNKIRIKGLEVSGGWGGVVLGGGGTTRGSADLKQHAVR